MAHTGPAPDRANTHGFQTDRLTIDLPTPDDAEVLYGLVGGTDRREVRATLLWDGPDDIAETREWIDQCATGTYADFGFHWVLRDRTGSITGTADRALGAIGTRPRGEPGRADVGYWLGRPYWGAGLMGEALGRLRMTREGVTRRAVRKYSELIDQAVYGILREEWDSA